MTLHELIVTRIRADGPISIADYMADCLLHPRFGYYATRDPLGAAGDFTTAPEISQMFGELIGLALAQAWMDQGRPSPFTLAEAGPGRGTLMADLLRAAGAVQGFAQAAQLVLIEASPVLEATQRDTLSEHAPRWIDTADALPEQPLFLVANEFFDALPIHQFIRQRDGWRERLIGLDGATLTPTLTLGLGPSQPRPELAHRISDTRDGDLAEICPAAAATAAVIGARIAAHGGAALIVDYGDWRSLGDTWQAVRNHASADPLADPGCADLTAHVDFEALATAAPCAHTRLTPQGVFLERLGITQRTRALAAGHSGAAIDKLAAATHRLTHPDEMGNLFKVLGLYPATEAPPPGLNP